jgi:tetratricopeptide (TPR) repeat protein
MRIPIALVIYVSLYVFPTARAFGEGQKTDWLTMHEAGLAALGRQNYDEAAECFQQSWLAASTEEEKGVSANDAGQVLRRLKRRKEAREWLLRAYAVWKSDPLADYNLAVAASSLGTLYRDDGDYREAETLLRAALGARKLESNSAATIRNDLADLLREEGRIDEATPLFAESLGDSSISLARRVDALSGAADADRQRGDMAASAKKWNEVLEIALAQKDEFCEAVASRGLAAMYLTAGDLSRAEPLYRRSLSLLESNPATPRQDLATTLSSVAALYRAQNKLALAEDAWSRALKLDREVLGDVHPQVAWVMEMLADVYSARGESHEAEDYSSQAVETMQRLFGDKSMPTAVALANRATVEQRANAFDRAAGDYERAVGIAREHPANDGLEKLLMERYADLLKAMHRNREAKEISKMAHSFHTN